jgi:hypothetical protein
MILQINIYVKVCILTGKGVVVIVDAVVDKVVGIGVVVVVVFGIDVGLVPSRHSGTFIGLKNTCYYFLIVSQFLYYVVEDA